MNRSLKIIISGIAASLLFTTIALPQTNTFPATGNVGIGIAAPASKLDILPANGNAISIRPFGTAANNTGQLQFKELSANGTNYIGFRAPDALASNYIFRLPVNYGTNGQTLTTNGAGVLSWTSGSGASLSLNNLTATSINQSLRPGTTNARDLGTSTLGWKDMYLTGAFYMDGLVFLKNTGGISMGAQAGNSSTGNFNIFLGNASGFNNTVGASNVFLGFESGSQNISGDGNTFIGDLTGQGNSTGNFNTLIGAGSELGSTALVNATAIGSGAVVNASNAVILGSNAQVGIGTSTPAAKLHVSSNSDIVTPQLLLFESENDYARLNFKNSTSSSYWSVAGINGAANANERLNFYNSTSGNVMSLTGNGNVCIGTVTPATGYKLSVNGKVICEEMKVQLNNQWPDYVFHDDHRLTSLTELEKFTKENHHLPGVPSAKEIAKSGGVEVGYMQTVLLEKIEELTLYIIEQEKKILSLQASMENLNKAK